jgi:hypothetical protein
MRWWLLACLSGCGFERHEMLSPPRLIAPLSTTRVNNSKVMVRFTLPPPLSSPVVEACRRRDFNGSIVGGEVAADGASAVLALDQGLWYWRVRAGSPMGPATSSIWQLRVVQQLGTGEAHWGSSLDLDGDGYDELAVGAPETIVFTDGTGDGRVWVYAGGPGGPDPARFLRLDAPTYGSSFGFSLAAIDFNGDGYADLAVGAPQAGAAGSPRGQIYVFLGGPHGIRLQPDIAFGVAAGGDFGWALDGAGDFDGDGYGDLVVGAPTTQLGNSLSGRAYIAFGGADSYRGIGPLDTESSGVVQVGIAVAGGGDLDGDGLDDVVIGAPGGGAGGHAWLVYGGIRSGEPVLLDPGAPLNAHFGYRITFRGDLDGDGLVEFAVGAPDEGAGRVYLYAGGGLTPTGTLDGSQNGDHFGTSLASGDADGDGVADLAVSAPCAPLGPSCDGKVYLYTAGPAVWNGPADSSFGIGLSMGDLDGDGQADVAVGSSEFANALGRVDWFKNPGDPVKRILNGIDPGARFGYAVR